MGKWLYENSNVFKENADLVSKLIESRLGYNLASLLYSKTSQRAELDLLNDTFYTQPALFLVGYSLAKYWISQGVKPDHLIGHSVGEFSAAAISEAISLEDAVSLICERARLVKAVKEGSMLAVSPARMKSKII